MEGRINDKSPKKKFTNQIQAVGKKIKMGTEQTNCSVPVHKVKGQVRPFNSGLIS